MNSTLSQPGTLLLLCLLGGFIVGVNLTLIGLLRGDSRVRAEASKWTAAVTGGRSGRVTQEAQLADLRRAVEQLKPPPSSTQDPPHD